jgi:hypothetical protein
VRTTTIEHVRKRKLTLNIHSELVKRVEDAAILQGRTFISVLEIALAEHLCAPVADPALPEAPLLLQALMDARRVLLFAADDDVTDEHDHVLGADQSGKAGIPRIVVE